MWPWRIATSKPGAPRDRRSSFPDDCRRPATPAVLPGATDCDVIEPGPPAKVGNSRDMEPSHATADGARPVAERLRGSRLTAVVLSLVNFAPGFAQEVLEPSTTPPRPTSIRV